MCIRVILGLSPGPPGPGGQGELQWWGVKQEWHVTAELVLVCKAGPHSLPWCLQPVGVTWDGEGVPAELN